jgi:hypothetical protein
MENSCARFKAIRSAKEKIKAKPPAYSQDEWIGYPQKQDSWITRYLLLFSSPDCEGTSLGSLPRMMPP